MPINGEIQAICEEFHEELGGLLDFAQIGKSSAEISLAPRARVAAANGATLLLAALYEECIRQMVKATFNHKKQKAKGIGEFPDKLAASVWKRSFEKLARRPFDEVQGSFSVTNSEINGILSFCLKGDLSSDVSAAISHNDNNMRPDEMARIFKQIGVSSIVSKLGSEKVMQDFLGTENATLCADTLRNEVEDFFRRRNEIAHAIQISSSSGPTGIVNDVNLFKSVTTSLVQILSKEMG